MANWPDAVKIDRLFKWMFLRARGDSNSQYFEENIPTGFDVHASEVYAEAIPSIPPSATSSVVKKWYPAGESGDGWIVLTRDKKYNGGRVWVALDSWNANWSSGSGNITQILKNFVSPKYGNQYVIRVYDGSNTLIPELDNSSWLFDYKAGVLTFETDRAEIGATQADCIKIKIYQYVGNFLDNVVSSSLGSRTIERLVVETQGQQDYTLSKTPQHPSLVDVIVNGIVLDEGASFDYTISSTALHFNTTSLDVSDKIVVKYW